MSSSSSAPRFHADPEEEQPDDDDDDGDNVEPNFHAGDGDVLPRSLWPTVQSAFASTGATGSLANRDLRSMASTATTIASKSVSAAAHASKGLSTLHLTAAGAAVAGVTAGTGGIALGVAGAAFTLASVATDGVSLIKTLDHLDGLETIQSTGSQDCQPLVNTGSPGTDHSFIEDKVLPWIIRQKKQKAVKKAASVAGLGLFTGGHRVVRAAYKAVRGVKGRKRNWYAHVLARHTISCRCKLAEQIVSELFTPQDYLAIREMDSDKAGDRIATKMKSV